MTGEDIFMVFLKVLGVYFLSLGLYSLIAIPFVDERKLRSWGNIRRVNERNKWFGALHPTGSVVVLVISVAIAVYLMFFSGMVKEFS